MLAGARLRGVLHHPDPPLTDGVITLRPKRREDVDALVAACQDQEIPRWTRVPQPYRREDALGWIAASQLELAAGRGVHWLAMDARDRLLGTLGVMEIDRDAGTAEIGYWVAREARGRGVARRAVALAYEWAVGKLGLTTVEIVVHEDNTPSCRVARAAGFTAAGERDVPPREGLPPGRYVVHRRGP